MKHNKNTKFKVRLFISIVSAIIGISILSFQICFNLWADNLIMDKFSEDLSDSPEIIIENEQIDMSNAQIEMRKESTGLFLDFRWRVFGIIMTIIGLGGIIFYMRKIKRNGLPS